MDAPRWFVEELEAYGKTCGRDLRIRYGERSPVAHWRIECRASFEKPLDPTLFKDPENYITARDGYFVCKKAPATMFETGVASAVIPDLIRSDPSAWGGGNAYADMLE